MDIYLLIYLNVFFFNLRVSLLPSIILIVSYQTYCYWDFALTLSGSSTNVTVESWAEYSAHSPYPDAVMELRACLNTAMEPL